MRPPPGLAGALRSAYLLARQLFDELRQHEADIARYISASLAQSDGLELLRAYVVRSQGMPDGLLSPAVAEWVRALTDRR